MKRTWDLKEGSKPFKRATSLLPGPVLLRESLYSSMFIFVLPGLFLTINYFLPLLSGVLNSLTGENRVIVPFLACGDLRGFDSDMTYPVEVSSCHGYLIPTPTRTHYNLILIFPPLFISSYFLLKLVVS